METNTLSLTFEPFLAWPLIAVAALLALGVGAGRTPALVAAGLALVAGLFPAMLFVTGLRHWWWRRAPGAFASHRRIGRAEEAAQEKLNVIAEALAELMDSRAQDDASLGEASTRLRGAKRSMNGIIRTPTPGSTSRLFDISPR